MRQRILFVDDESLVLQGLRRMLYQMRNEWDMEFAESGARALELMNQQPFDVVVTDMRMPGMDGVQLLMKVREQAPDTVRIMLTGNADQQTAVEAVNKGHVYRFLNKPCPPEMLALDAGIQQFRRIATERELLENTLNGSIQVLTEILSAVDPRSFGRGQHLREHMRTFLTSLGVQTSWEYEIAAMLSQIGFVTIPPGVLQRAREDCGLTPTEKDMLLRVPETGYDLLSKIPRLEEVAQTIRYQDKNFDGSGLPTGPTVGEEIPIASRILKVLSDLAQLEAHGMPKAEALVAMQARKGRYDPRVLDAAFKCFDAYLPVSSTVKSQSQAVRAAELHSGQLLLSNVVTKDGLLIVPAGQRLSPVIVEKIRNFAKIRGIQEPVHVEM